MASTAGATPAVQAFPPQEYAGPDQIFTIAQRADGPLLFATVDGLREYDGERWRQIELPGSQIALAVDDEGRIWTSGPQQLGYLEPDESGSPRFVSLLDQLPGDPEFSLTWPILATPEGVFFASREWLFRWHEGGFHSWPGDPEKTFYRLYRIHGRIFVTQLGVGLLEWVNESLRVIEANDLPEDAELNFMFGTDDGAAIVLTRRHGAYRFDGHRLEAIDTAGEPWLLDHQVQHGCELPDGRIAIGSVLGGIGLFDRTLGEPEVIDERADLPANLVHFVLTDHQGQLWAGTDVGAARIKIESSVDRLGIDDGIDGFINSVLATDDELWVAAASGLFVDLDGVEPYRFDKVEVPGPAWSLIAHGDGVLAATSEGVFEIRVRRNDDLSLVVPREIHGDPAVELFPVPGRNDEVLSSLENGFGWFIREPEGWAWNGRVPGVTSEARTAIEGPDGELIAWAPSRDRLIRLSFGDQPRTPPTVRTHDLGDGGWPVYVDDRVVFLRSGGIERYLGHDAEGWPFEPDPSFDPLIELSGGTPFILHQDDNLLWLDTSDGLRLVERSDSGELRSRPMDADEIDNLVDIYVDPDHSRHFLASSDGLFLYRQSERTATQPLDVLIRSVDVPGSESSLYGGFGPASRLVLPEDHDDLRLELAASRAHNAAMEYQVQIDSEAWSPWTENATHDLTNLGYGDHTIRVRARDAWGTVSTEQSVAINVPWPWWLSIWALAIWAIGFTALLTVAVRLRTGKLDSERRRLESLVAERTQTLAERTADLELKTRALEAANRQLAEENEHRRQLEQERGKLEARVEQSKKLESLGLMAGGIAHDFNNILMAVLGHADLGLEERDVPESLDRRLRDIRSAAWQAAELCRQMLAYAGKRRIQHSEVDLSRIAAECLATVEVTASPRVRFEVDLPEGLPAVRGDAGQLRQVAANLLSNATEAFIDGAAGRVELATEARSLRREDFVDMLLAEPLPTGSYLVLRVRDDGIGMDEATRRRIFDPFFTTKFTGRGLGLAATLGIVRAHQGTLRVESQPGQGTLVEVYLPALDHVAETPADDLELVASSRDRGGTVLVIDDETIVRDVACLMLSNAGFEVLEAASGEAAIELFERHREQIAVVLIDLSMPGLDGVETFQALREIDSDITAVLSSGYSVDDITERYVEIGFKSFLHKPYRTKTLRHAVLSALEADDDAMSDELQGDAMTSDKAAGGQ